MKSTSVRGLLALLAFGWIMIPSFGAEAPSLAASSADGVTDFFTDFAALPAGATLSSAATVSNGECVLTPAVAGRQGFLTLAPLTGTPTAFVAEFYYRAYDGTGADGTSFNYGVIPASFPSNPEYRVVSTGLAIGLVEYTSQVLVRFNGTQLASASFALWNANYRKVRVVVDSLGRLSIQIGDTAVLSNVDLGSTYRTADKSTWKVCFGSRSGGGMSNRHSLDDLYFGTSGFVPPRFSFTEDLSGGVAFYGMPFKDADSSQLTVTLSVPTGTISATAVDGIAVGGSGGSRSFTGSPESLNAYFTKPGNITYLGASNTTGEVPMDIVVSDGDLSASGSTILNIVGVNDAPEAVAGFLTSIPEDVDPQNNFGSQVSEIVSGCTDGDPGALKGMAITAVGESNGKWYFTTDGGVTWNSLTGVTASAARLLSGENSNHRIRFVPVSNYAGTASLTFRAWDQTSGTAGSTANVSINGGSTAYSVGEATATISVTQNNDSPTVTSIGNQTTNEDTTTGSIGFTVGDVETAVSDLTVTATSSNESVVAGSGIALSGSGAARTLRLTPVADATGTSLITVLVSDGTETVTTSFMLTVTAVNDAPVASAQAVTVNEDTSASITLSGTDVEGSGLTYAVVTQPTKGVLSGTAPNLVYTPTANATGNDSFTFKVNDGIEDSVSETVTIEITAVNDVPSATAQSVTATEDTAQAITLAGTDVEGSPLTYTVLTQPTKGVLSGTAPNLVYTPNANATGADSFTFKVNDGIEDSVAETVTIEITAVNDVPVATAQSVTVTEDMAQGITLTGTDVEGSPLTHTVVTQPTKGVLSGTAPNLVYTPNANATGTDSFTFKVNDGSADSATATVTITISPVNDAPTWVADGSTALKAAASPAAIKALTGTTQDGVYWVLVNGVATQVYCLMDSAIDSGGWMLAMKAANTGGTFGYFSPHWVQSTTLNPTYLRRNVTPYNEDAKFSVFNDTPADKLMAIFPDVPTAQQGGAVTGQSYGFIWIESMPTPANTASYTGRPVQGTYTGKTLRQLFEADEKIFIRDATATTPYKANGSTVFSSQTGVRFFGFNYRNANGGNGWNRARFGFGWNENDSGLYPNAAETSNDVSGGIGLDRADWSAGDIVACCQNALGLNRQMQFELYVKSSVSSASLLAGLTPIPEEVSDAANTGTSVADLAAGFVDPDTGAVSGIAIVGVDETNGAWFYSVDGGSSWSSLTGVSSTAARLLRGDDSLSRVRFVPNGSFTGTATITFHGWDQTSGVGGEVVSLTATGGSSGYSQNAVTGSIAVTPVNDAPALTGSGGETLAVEQVAVAVDSGITLTDQDSSGLASATISITGGLRTSEDVLGYTNPGTHGNITGAYNSSTGVLTLTSAGWIATLSQWQAALRAVTYRNASDNPTLENRTVGFVVNDGYDSSAAILRTVSVSSLNDAPVAANRSLDAILEDVALASNAGTLVSTIVSSCTDADTGAVKGMAVVAVVETNGAWFYTVDGGATWSSLTGVSATSARLLKGNDPNYRIRFVPNANYFGNATLTFRAWDQTSGAAGATADVSVNGGSTAFSSGTATGTITVTAVNDAPVAADGTLTAILENVASGDNTGTVVSAIVASCTDVETSAVKGMAVIGADETNGKWFYTINGGTTWLSLTGVSGTTARLLKGNDVLYKVRFVPNLNFSGTATLTFRAWDQTVGAPGGTANLATTGGSTPYSANTATATITVTAVNSAPLVTTPSGISVLDTIADDTFPSITGVLSVSDPDGDSLTYGLIRPVGGSIDFGSNVDDGTYLALASSEDFNFGTGDFTIETWAKVTSSTFVIYDAGVDVNAPGGFAFWSEGGTLKIRINGLAADLGTPFSPNWLNTWTHYAVARQDGTVTIYVNGVAVASGSRTQNITRTAPFIGRLDKYSGYGLQGQISDLRVIKGSAAYTAAFSPPTTRLLPVSGTVLLLSGDSQRGYLTDTSVSAHTVTTYGTPAYSESGPPLQGLAMTAVAGVVTREGRYGTLTLNAATGAYAYQPSAAAVNAVPGGVTGSEEFTLTVGDGTETVNTTLGVTVTGADDRPQIRLAPGATAATEQQAVSVDAALTISDVDSTTLSSATVSIGVGFESGMDVLGYPGGHGNIQSSFDAASGVLTLTSSPAAATIAEWQAALRAVTFVNASDAPRAGNRTLGFVAWDATSGSLPSSKIVTLSAVNDAPGVTDATAPVDLAAILEDSTPMGSDVSSIVGSRFVDPDNGVSATPLQDPFSGVAILFHPLDASAGRWQYQIASSGTWVDLPGVATAAQSVTLAATDHLRFLPAANFNGAAPALTVALMDSSQTVVSGAVVDARVRGGATGFSAAVLEIRLSVTPVADTVVLEGLLGVSKVYDGTRIATVTGNPRLTGVSAGDDVQLSGTPVFTFAQATVGTGIAIEVSGYTLTGAQGAQYTLELPALSADITAKALSITGLTASDKVYDGVATASVTGTAQLDGVVGTDQVSLAGTPSFLFVQATVGEALDVTGSGFILAGTDAPNYSLIQPVLQASITRKGLDLTGMVAADKIYDGTTAAALGFTGASLNGILTGDTVELDISGASGAFADPAVGLAKAVTITGLSLTGASAANYMAIPPSDLTAAITPRALTLEVRSATRAYRASNPTFSIAEFSSQLAAGDSKVDIIGGEGTDADVTFRLASTGLTSPVGAYPGEIGLEGSSLDGAKVANYAIQVTPGDLEIVPASLVITLDSASLEQVYDGTPRAVVWATDPAGVPVRIRYRNSAVAPAIAGVYTVVASSDDPNYVGEVTGTLRITSTLASLRSEAVLAVAGLAPMTDDGGRYLLLSSLGQPLAGDLNSGDGLRLEIGFWFADASSAFWELGVLPVTPPTTATEEPGVEDQTPAPIRKVLQPPDGSQVAPRVSPDAIPRLIVVAPTGVSPLQIRIFGRPGSRWRIQTQDQLNGDAWREAGSLRLDAQGRGRLHDDLHSGSELRFYRLLAE